MFQLEYEDKLVWNVKAGEAELVVDRLIWPCHWQGK